MILNPGSMSQTFKLSGDFKVFRYQGPTSRVLSLNISIFVLKLLRLNTWPELRTIFLESSLFEPT